MSVPVCECFRFAQRGYRVRRDKQTREPCNFGVSSENANAACFNQSLLGVDARPNASVLAAGSRFESPVAICVHLYRASARHSLYRKQARSTGCHRSWPQRHAVLRGQTHNTRGLHADGSAWHSSGSRVYGGETSRHCAAECQAAGRVHSCTDDRAGLSSTTVTQLLDGRKSIKRRSLSRSVHRDERAARTAECEQRIWSSDASATVRCRVIAH